MADLDAFMAAHSVRPWEWGVTDCSLVLADWAMANGRPDPAPHLREAYASDLEWKRIVVARGGLLPLVSDICDRAGIGPASSLARGVIAVVGSRHNIERQWGAIFDGERFQVRHAEGFITLTAHSLGLWEVG